MYFTGGRRSIVRRQQPLLLAVLALRPVLPSRTKGPAGQLPTEIRSVFYFPARQRLAGTGYSRMYRGLARGDGISPCACKRALGQEDLPLSLQMSALPGNGHRAHVTNRLYRRTGDTRQTINTWVSDKTNRQDPNLLPPRFHHPPDPSRDNQCSVIQRYWMRQFESGKYRGRGFPCLAIADYLSENDAADR